MHRILISLLFSLFISTAGLAQIFSAGNLTEASITTRDETDIGGVRHIPDGNRATAAATDSVTWRLYQEKDWPELLKTAEKAILDGIDFYYLRVRAGVAARELKKYGKAVRHLAKAREEYSDDDFTNGYLYSSLALAGRDDEAAFLASRLTHDARERLNISLQGTLNSLSVENYLSKNSSQASLMAEDIREEGSYSNYRSVLRHQWYKNVGIDLHVSPRFNFFTNVSHITIGRTQHFSSAPNLVEEFSIFFHRDDSSWERGGVLSPPLHCSVGRAIIISLL